MEIIWLPKTNKSLEKLPLHPIISIVGNVTRNVAKQIDKIIKQYLNSDFILLSSDEFFDKVKTLSIKVNCVPLLKVC